MTVSAYIISVKIRIDMQSNFNGTNYWKCVLGMDSSSHWELIIVPSQKAKGDNLGMSFQPSVK